MTRIAFLNLHAEHMLQDKVTRVYLDVWEHNPGAFRFYQRFGFEVVGRQKFEVASCAETSDDLVMVYSF